MTAAVETMAYTNQEPWHGLGTYIKDAPSVKEILRLAKLDWQVQKIPVYFKKEDKHLKTVEGKFALVRDSDQKCFDVVGRHYTPVQNDQAFGFFKEFVEAGNATMETAGSLRGGRYVWGLANLKASFKLSGDDEVKGYLLVAAPHEAGKAFLIKFTTIRVVCNNTLTLALGQAGKEFRMPHRREFDNAMVRVAKDALGIAREQMSTFEKNARVLKALNMTEKDVIRVLAPVYQPQRATADVVKDFDKFGSHRMKMLLDVNKNAPGADPETGWGVLNAVTYFSDHVASRTADKRLTNAWFGKTARHKETVLNTLLEMAA